MVEHRPSRRLSFVLPELWSHRGVALAFAERDARLKYKQATLGIAWAVLQPLLLMGIMTLTFGRIAGLSGGGVPYAAFALSALVPWTFLQTSIGFGSNSLVTDASLVRRIYFPREVRVFGSIGASVLDLGIGLLLFMSIGPLLGAHVTVYWLLAIALCVPLAALATGIALALAALNVYYRDFRHALPVMLQLWLFASPVAYPISVVPERWRGIYLAFNPAAGILDSMRRTLALGAAPDWGYLAASAGGTIVILAFAYRIFKRLEQGFAEVI